MPIRSSSDFPGMWTTGLFELSATWDKMVELVHFYRSKRFKNDGIAGWFSPTSSSLQGTSLCLER